MPINIFTVDNDVDPKTLNLDPNPEFWPNLDMDPDPGMDPDPRLSYQFWRKTILEKNYFH